MSDLNELKILKVGLSQHLLAIMQGWRGFRSSWPFHAFVTVIAILALYVAPAIKAHLDLLLVVVAIFLFFPAIHHAWRGERETANSLKKQLTTDDSKWREHALRDGPRLDLRWEQPEFEIDGPTLYLFNEADRTAKQIRILADYLFCHHTIDGKQRQDVSIAPIEVVSAEETGGSPVFADQSWTDIIRPGSSVTVIVKYADHHGLAEYHSIFDVRRPGKSRHIRIDSHPPLITRIAHDKQAS